MALVERALRASNERPQPPIRGLQESLGLILPDDQLELDA